MKIIPYSILIISTLLTYSCNRTITNKMKNSTDTFSWQGHRGARGLAPENTIPAFIKALEYNVHTLELDVVVSKDKKIIVSHEPYFSHYITTKPDGTAVTKKEEQSLLTYHMDYEEIKQYDCGIRGHAKFPEQVGEPAFKPSFKDMVKAVDAHCRKNKLPKPNFNIEMKSYAKYYGKANPYPKEFVEIMLQELTDLKIKKRTNLQAFDFDVLREIKKQDPDMEIAMLVEFADGRDVNKHIKKLGFKPDIYSPDHKLLFKKVIKQCHDMDIRVIPWTVNKVERMKTLIRYGVDGLITDYPNRIELVK